MGAKADGRFAPIPICACRSVDNHERSAIVEGDIETPSLTISDGAQVLGKFVVTRREEPRRTGDIEAEANIRKFAPRNVEDATEPARAG
ncbi:MAG TPA: polymer-forming cytoskeletal protein [Parvularculaceae bacterium]|nr:polymer-forming cytoskeletal protein [Parvularculaceae bacterium]